MRLGVGAQKDGGTESLGTECHGIYGNPASGTHLLPLYTERKFHGDKLIHP